MLKLEHIVRGGEFQMGISPEIKYQELSEPFKKHLEFIDATSAKAAVWAIILLLYDTSLLVGLPSIEESRYLWGISPMALVVHLWGLRLLFKNAYSTQMEMVLFIGVLGLIGSMTSFLLILGLSIHTLSITSMLYYIIMCLVVIVSTVFVIQLQINKYKGDPKGKNQVNKGSKYKTLLYIGPGLGVVIAGLTRDTNIYIETIAIIGIIFMMYLVYVYFASRFIHKYFFIKANMHLVTFQKPNKKKDQIQLNKKRVKIK